MAQGEADVEAEGCREEEGLLRHAMSSFETSPTAPVEEESQIDCRSVAKELVAQSKLSGPLSLGLVANYCLTMISLSFVGQLGTEDLAAASLGTTVHSMAARLTMMGLCGALDTYASQAAGSGNLESLGPIFQRAVLFLLLHSIPIMGVFVALPRLLRAMGQPAELTGRVGAYLAALLPAVVIDAVYRPINRTLVAQHVTLPQMWVSGVVAAQHFGAAYLAVFTFGGGYLGAAYATVWSNLLATLLLAAYVKAAGLQARVWGTPSRAALQGWPAFTRLAYASAAAKTSESWGFGACTVAAGWLPHPDSAVSALTVAYSIYGFLYMGYAAQSVAACTRVGNALGAGRAPAARLAALAASLSAPLLWVPIAAVLLAPPSQRLLIRLFSDGHDELLVHRIRGLLDIVVVLELFDGIQTVMSGVVSGAGKQAWGFIINTASFWALALPAAFLLGFAAHQGVTGMYGGMTLGPITQTVCYLVLLLRLRWKEEAEEAQWRVREASAAL